VNPFCRLTCFSRSFLALWLLIGLIGLVNLDSLDSIGVGESDGLDGGCGDEGSQSAGGSVFHVIMKIIGASDAPLIFVISLFSVFLWALDVTGNYTSIPISTEAARHFSFSPSSWEPLP